MKQRLLQLTLLLCLFSHSDGKILRNNALMSKMVSEFRSPPQTRVVDTMRNVLCRHFPAIPCEVITKDEALQTLILRTVKMLNKKQRDFQNATVEPPNEQTEVPAINSEELSHYLAVENTGYFTDKHKQKERRIPRVATPKAAWSDEVDRGQKHPRAIIPGRKNIRKFFPHKIKYKDNVEKNELDSREQPISEEVRDMSQKKRTRNYNFQREPSNMPLWQIDYTKHGEPRLMYSHETDHVFKGKLVKLTGDTEGDVLKHRKSVLRPNVYIKKSSKREMNYT